MKRHIIILSFFVFSVQFLACGSNNLWENLFNTHDVSSVRAVSNTGVEIVFKGQVEQASAENPANYTINGLTVNSATRDAVDFTKVTLTTSSQQGIEYSLIITNVETSNGRIIDTTNTPNRFMGNPLFGIVSVTATSVTSVDVVFSKELDPACAEIISNYSIPGLGISAADFDLSRTVHLTTSAQTYTSYTLTVNNIVDIDGNDIEPSLSFKNFMGYLFRVSSATAVNNTHVDVNFTNDVELISSQTPGNYPITGASALNVISATRDSINHKLVHLETGSQVQGVYTLTASSNIKSVINEDLSSMPVTFDGDALPCITLAEATSSTGVRVTFSENMGNGANVAANYTIPGLTVISAGVSGNIVDLVTSEQTEAVLYTLTVNNVYDTTSPSPNLIDPSGKTFAFTGDGRPKLDHAWWVVIVDYVGPPSLALNHFRVYFSENVNDTEATNPGNYSITYIPTSTPLNVTSAIWINDSTYELTTNQQIDGTDNYSLSAANIHDLSVNNNLINPANSITFDGKHCPYVVGFAPVTGFPKMIDIEFSEPMNTSTCETPENYNINGTGPLSASIENSYYDVVRLVMPASFNFISGEQYTITVYNVTDGVGNMINTPGNVYSDLWP